MAHPVRHNTQLIDFFAKEAAPAREQTYKSRGFADQRGKQVRQSSPDLTLSLQLPGPSKVLHQASFTEPPAIKSNIIQGHEPLLLSSARRYQRYAWQRRLHNDAQVEEVYRMVGSKWGKLPKSTLDDAIKKLDRYLEASPDDVDKVRRQDKGVIQDIADATNRKGIHRGRKAKGPIRIDQMPLTVEEMLQRRKARPKSVAGMFGLGKPQRAAPRWGSFLAREDRDKLVDRLVLVWGVPPEVVKRRMYGIEPDALRTHLPGILSDEEEVYTQHAKQLLPYRYSVYVPHRRPSRRPSHDSTQGKPAEPSQMQHWAQ